MAAWAWRSTVAFVLRPTIWLPFVIVAGVQGLALLFLMGFHQNALLPIGLPIVKLLGGEQATHYPVFFFALPTMFFRANLVISTLLASVTGGAATLLFARAFGFNDARGAWGRALRCAPALIVLTLLVVAILFGIAALARMIPQEVAQQSFAARWGVRGGTMLLFVLVQSFMAYSTAWIVLMGHKIWPAIRDSVRVTSRTFLPTLIAVGIPAVLLFPFSYVTGRLDLIVGKLRPEVLAGILGGQILVQFLITFFLVGAITRLFIWRMEAAR